jgi:hypothetical protein
MAEARRREALAPFAAQRRAQSPREFPISTAKLMIGCVKIHPF